MLVVGCIVYYVPRWGMILCGRGTFGILGARSRYWDVQNDAESLARKKRVCLPRTPDVPTQLRQF